jgi:hypothetical protein
MPHGMPPLPRKLAELNQMSTMTPAAQNDHFDISQRELKREPRSRKVLPKVDYSQQRQEFMQ